jgi:hypothetical protein
MTASDGPIASVRFYYLSSIQACQRDRHSAHW